MIKAKMRIQYVHSLALFKYSYLSPVSGAILRSIYKPAKCSFNFLEPLRLDAVLFLNESPHPVEHFQGVIIFVLFIYFFVVLPW